MAKPIHSMVRVLNEERSLAFYAEVFGMSVVDRFDYPDFSLIYLATSESTFELELTVNRSQSEPYEVGNGYGHLAFAVEDLEASHAAAKAAGYAPRDIVEFKPGGALLAKFYFIADPDGYQVEVIQQHGRYR
ncbi:VOC family protein [Cognatishimia sp. SS12]|uniref:VOC family protein n=1 Tax=Cognatishimia sp. SS12 TaxID=2979465 RepID=UPI00232ED9A5|nr:VOC family protein [Cognatishimia sp. SS12]MDC0738185.1 VOC family protein [Cognatishimia sp. SS12]